MNPIERSQKLKELQSQVARDRLIDTTLYLRALDGSKYFPSRHVLYSPFTPLGEWDLFKLNVANTIDAFAVRHPSLLPYIKGPVGMGCNDYRLEQEVAPLLAAGGNEGAALAMAGPNLNREAAVKYVIGGLGQRIVGDLERISGVKEPVDGSVLARLGYVNLFGGVKLEGANQVVGGPAHTQLFQEALNYSSKTAMAVLMKSPVGLASLLLKATQDQRMMLAELIESEAPESTANAFIRKAAEYYGDPRDLLEPEWCGSGGKKIGVGISSMYYPEYW